MKGARCTNYEYDVDDQIIYKGENLDTKAVDDDPDFEITKFTWSSGLVTKKQIAHGSWTDRASHFA